ncbi:transcription factor S [Nitrosopumilus oxyclinae]|uniref:Transcription factor S n=1 Tax=Nitrosopumilus oxyclinae TaxID=1959104 RepID=A0A7D5R1M0_9ARCH|nr:transcription factor S [Nitrosopumilus oxyclinae]QLH05440.1 transcription factor S [Nitrosopumilus oxyclinae]
MKFCPKCEVKLKNSGSGLQCSKCGYTDGEKAKPTKKIAAEEEPDFSLLAFEGDEGEESNPTVKIDCEKCGHDEAVGWMFQTRSADEPTTRFYRCQKCKYTWRDYT